jgi:hypothetical protein
MSGYTELTNAIGHCIGYGQEDAEFYFFGLEEKSQDINDANPNYDKYYTEYFEKSKGFYAIPNRKFSQSKISGGSIYNTYLYFYNELTNNRITEIKDFLNDKTPILIGNIWPFSKNKNSDKYTDEQQNWLSDNETKRNNFILNFLLEKSQQNKKIFIFGKRDDRKKMFENHVKSSNLNIKFNYYKFDKSSPKYYFVESSNQSLFLLNHPSSSWGRVNLSRPNLDELSKRIHEQNQQ